MNCCKFGLSKNDTMHLLKELMSVKRIESVVLKYCPSGFLFLKNKGVNYRVDKTQKLTDGSSMMTEYGNIFAVNIGVQGMFDNYYVDDMDFAKVVWVLEHEFIHVCQCNDNFQKSNSSEFVKCQAIEVLSSYDNPIYYKSFHNYEKNSNELEAEYYGFVCMVDYLYATFDNVSVDYIDSIIVDLVNKQCENDYFLHPDRKFTTVDEIKTAFQDAYVNSFYAMKDYPIPGTDTFDNIFGDVHSNHCLNTDSFACCMANDDKLRFVFEHANSRYEQDLIVACINKELHPEYCSSFRCLDDVDLSYDTVVLHRYDELIQADNISNSLYEQRYRETYERNFGQMNKYRELPYVDCDDSVDIFDDYDDSL